MHCEQAARRFFLMFVLLEGACACFTARQAAVKANARFFTDCGELASHFVYRRLNSLSKTSSG
jgi:hypothetical protein